MCYCAGAKDKSTLKKVNMMPLIHLLVTSPVISVPKAAE